MDFSADFNPLGPPAGLQAVWEEGLSRLESYPEPTYRRFREAAAQREGVSPEQVLPGNGTADLIHLVSRFRPRSTAAVVVPTFTEFERAVAADGGTVLPWMLEEESGFSPEFLRAPGPIPAGGILFLCNPNNPTGTLWPRPPLRRLIEEAEGAGAVAVVDEAYLDFVEEGERHSAIEWLNDFKRLIILRSMTKAFAVPGLRVGYALSSISLIEDLKRFQPPWPMNTLAAQVGEHLARVGEGHLALTHELLPAWRSHLEEGLRALGGIRPYPSHANFLLCRLEDPAWTAGRLKTALARRGILIRDCGDFTGLGGGRFFRVAVRREEENAVLLSGFRELLGGSP